MRTNIDQFESQLNETEKEEIYRKALREHEVKSQTQTNQIFTKHVLYPKQAEFVNSQARYTLYSGAVRGGKTLALIYRTLVLAKPHTRGLLGAFTYPMISDIIIPKLMDVLSVFPQGSYHFEDGKRNLIIDHGKGPAVVMLRHLENEGVIQGKDLNYYCIDEATVGIKENTFEMLNSRLSEGPVQHANIATNPGGTMHYLYKRFFEEHKDNSDWKVIRAKTIDNPHLPKAYLQDLSTKSDAWKLRYMEGKWGTTEGIIYDEFDPDIHIKKAPEIPLDYYLAIDFGYTNPFACLLIGKDSDDNYYIIDEYYQSKVTIPDHAKVLKERFVDRYKIEGMCCDVAQPGDRRQLEEALEITRITAQKDVNPGIQIVKQALIVKGNGLPSLTIDPSCSNLRMEFESYEWEPATEFRNAKEEPRKYNDHGLDALRYLIYSLRSSSSGYMASSS